MYSLFIRFICFSGRVSWVLALKQFNPGFSPFFTSYFCCYNHENTKKYCFCVFPVFACRCQDESKFEGLPKEPLQPFVDSQNSLVWASLWGELCFGMKNSEFLAFGAYRYHFHGYCEENISFYVHSKVHNYVVSFSTL